MTGWTVNDTAPDLTGQCLNGTTPVNLTGATLELHIRKPDGTTLTGVPTVVSATEGIWSYPWQVGDLDPAGTYRVELQATSAAGVQTFAGGSFPVNREIG